MDTAAHFDWLSFQDLLIAKGKNIQENRDALNEACVAQKVCELFHTTTLSLIIKVLEPSTWFTD